MIDSGGGDALNQLFSTLMWYCRENTMLHTKIKADYKLKVLLSFERMPHNGQRIEKCIF